MNYKATDLAVIIPTKDRPQHVKLHLEGLVKQNCEIGKVIVVSSGKDIQNIIFESFDCKSIRLINYTNNNIYIYIYINKKSCL